MQTHNLGCLIRFSGIRVVVDVEVGMEESILVSSSWLLIVLKSRYSDGNISFTR